MRVFNPTNLSGAALFFEGILFGHIEAIPTGETSPTALRVKPNPHTALKETLVIHADSLVGGYYTVQLPGVNGPRCDLRDLIFKTQQQFDFEIECETHRAEITVVARTAPSYTLEISCMGEDVVHLKSPPASGVPTKLVYADSVTPGQFLVVDHRKEPRNGKWFYDLADTIVTRYIDA